MIEMRKAEKYKGCDVCSKQQNVTYIRMHVKHFDGFYRGLEINLCDNCMRELKHGLQGVCK